MDFMSFSSISYEKLWRVKSVIIILLILVSHKDYEVIDQNDDVCSPLVQG